MSKFILAICDSEEEYLLRLQSYLYSDTTLAMEILIFSDLSECIAYADSQRVDLAVISELLEVDSKMIASFGKVIRLTEEEKDEGICKYRSGEYFLGKIKSIIEKELPNHVQRKSFGDLQMIGFYSPVGRCLQTSMSLSMGQILAKDYRVLYIPFDAYSGFESMMQYPGEFTSDLSDLMYYLKNLEDRFVYQLRNSIIRLNSLDILPPALSFVDLSTLARGDWEKLFESIAQLNEYQYVILDLSHHVQGVLDILRGCKRIITITKPDSYARSKQAQYEKLLLSLNYTDILERTQKYELPMFMDLPVKIERLMYIELIIFGDHNRKNMQKQSESNDYQDDSILRAEDKQATAKNEISDNERYISERRDIKTSEDAEEENNTSTVLMSAPSIEPKSRLVPIKGGEEISLHQLPILIGKSQACVDIVIDDKTISRMHARFFEENGKILLQDLNSTNGVFKNELRLEGNESVVIEYGDSIRFGACEYTYM